MSTLTSVSNATSLDPAFSREQDRFGELTSGDFMKIMLSEMSRQDPLKPNDSNALVEQMANIRSIQSDINLSERLERIVSQNELSSAGALIGKRISGISEEGRRVDGRVLSVSRTDKGPVLTVDSGARVPLAKVDVMQEVPASAPVGG